MQPTAPQTPPQKKSKKLLLWILVPFGVLFLLGGLVALGVIADLALKNLPKTSNNAGVDVAKVKQMVQATSPNIVSVNVEVSLDGFNHHLWVNPTISTNSITSTELDNILQVAYESSLGKVKAIEIRVETTDEEPVDITRVATELGIMHMDNINSVTYSTVYLDKAYGK